MKTALYLPTLPADSENPTRKFDTDQEAWEYIFDSMCEGCQKKRTLFFKLHAEGKSPDDFEEGSPEYYADEYPACACEWVVLDSDDLKKCGSFLDVMTSAGWEIIYDKNETVI
jgi:hypothetical protein